jgi:hypothetical protein
MCPEGNVPHAKEHQRSIGKLSVLSLSLTLSFFFVTVGGNNFLVFGQKLFRQVYNITFITNGFTQIVSQACAFLAKQEKKKKRIENFQLSVSAVSRR